MKGCQCSPADFTKYTFPDTDVCSAAAFGRFLCRDYDSSEEELLNGMLRSLDVSEQYPHAAIEAGKIVFFVFFGLDFGAHPY